VIVVLVVAPIIVTQTVEFANWIESNYQEGLDLLAPYIPEVSIERVTEWLQNNASSIGSAAQEVGNFLLSSVGTIFSSIVAFFTITLITFFYLIDKNSIKKFLDFVFPASKVARILPPIMKKAESWIFGQLALMSIVGVLNYIGFLIVGLEYAAPLALINGILEIVPIIGPIIGGVFPTIVGFTEDPYTGFGALTVVIIVQQIENNILVPKVMGSVVGLSPNVTLFSFMVGSTLFGLIGALLSVPAALFIIELMKTIYKKPTDDLVEDFINPNDKVREQFFRAKRALRLSRSLNRTVQ
jgi:predicted PurR-regulated permease PerM